VQRNKAHRVLRWAARIGGIDRNEGFKLADSTLIQRSLTGEVSVLPGWGAREGDCGHLPARGSGAQYLAVDAGKRSAASAGSRSRSRAPFRSGGCPVVSRPRAGTYTAPLNR
jgi:hypothetical protein